MKTRPLTVILIGLSALLLTACGGSSPQKIDFTAAAKNATIATRECKKLIGDDGAKLNALGDGPATGKVVGHLADYAPDANYFTCRAGGPRLYVMRDSARFRDDGRPTTRNLYGSDRRPVTTVVDDAISTKRKKTPWA